MPLKNFWSLEPGEAIFADELLKRFKGKADFYFPFKDTGIDLIGVTKNLKGIVSFQVKESRYHEYKNCAWHEVNKKKFANDRRKVDFYIFLIYFPRCLMKADKKKRNVFEKYFVIVPEARLLENIKSKNPRKKKKDYVYVFNFRLGDDNKKLFDVRESDLKGHDYSKYLNSWHLIEKKINTIARQRRINQ
jgi:hypothetical protein